MDEEVVALSVNSYKQTIAYFPGDGSVLWLDDNVADETTLLPVQRAVLVARLRTHAALIEDNGYR